MSKGSSVGGTVELVSLILEHVYSSCDQSTLLSCLLVNSTWKSEGERFLWQRCGWRNHDHWLHEKYQQPRVQQLIQLDDKRRQKYANSVKYLTIGHGLGVDKRGLLAPAGPATAATWDGRFFQQLAPLEFPSLQRLTLAGPPANDPSAVNEAPVYLVGSTLTSLVLQDVVVECTDPEATKGHFALTRAFLQAIMTQCKKLKQLRVSYTKKDLIEGQDLGYKAVGALFWLAAERLSLEGLALPFLAEEWVDGVFELDFNRPPFETLNIFEGNLCPVGLGRIAPFLNNLQYLRLYTVGRTTEYSLSALARLSKLEELMIRSCETPTTIEASDLLAISKANKNLRMVCFHGKRGTIKEMDDDFIEEFSRNLPELTSLTLVTQSTLATFDSLIWLGLNCPRLTVCYLPVYTTIFGAIYLKTSKKVTWPNLQFFRTTTTSNIWPSHLDSRILEAMVKMPKLRSNNAHLKRNWIPQFCPGWI